MDLTTLLTKLGDVIHSHFTGAPAPAPGAPAAPEEFLGKPGEAFDKAKAGLNALAGNVGQGADYAKAGWDKLRNRAMQEWNYDVHGISPQPEQPGAVYRPGVLDEPALQGIAAGNQSQYAKNPYMPEPQGLFRQSPISQFGQEPHDEFTGFPNTVRDPAYPPAPNQNLQSIDPRLPVGSKPNPTEAYVQKPDPTTDMREQFARAAQPAFRASDPNTDMRAQFTKVPRAPDPSTDMRAQFAAAAYGKPPAVSPKGTIQRIGPAPPPVQTGYNSEEVIRRQDELRKQQNAPKPLAGGVY
jgi:hypothetical protein